MEPRRHSNLERTSPEDRQRSPPGSPAKLSKLPADPIRESLLRTDYQGIIAYCSSSRTMNLIYSPCSSFEFWKAKVERERQYRNLGKFMDDIIKLNGNKTFNLILSRSLLTEEEKLKLFPKQTVDKIIGDGKTIILKSIFQNKAVTYNSLFLRENYVSTEAVVTLFEAKLLILQDQDLMNSYMDCVKEGRFSQRTRERGRMYNIILSIYGLNREWADLDLSIYPNSLLNIGKVNYAAYVVSDCVLDFSDTELDLSLGDTPEDSIYTAEELWKILFFYDSPEERLKPQILTKFVPFVNHLLHNYGEEEIDLVATHWIETNLIRHLYAKLDIFSNFIHEAIPLGVLLDYTISKTWPLFPKPDLLIREVNFFIANGYTFSGRDTERQKKENMETLWISIADLLTSDNPQRKVKEYQEKLLLGIIERLEEGLNEYQDS